MEPVTPTIEPIPPAPWPSKDTKPARWQRPRAIAVALLRNRQSLRGYRMVESISPVDRIQQFARERIQVREDAARSIEETLPAANVAGGFGSLRDVAGTCHRAWTRFRAMLSPASITREIRRGEAALCFSLRRALKFPASDRAGRAVRAQLETVLEDAVAARGQAKLLSSMEDPLAPPLDVQNMDETDLPVESTERLEHGPLEDAPDRPGFFRGLWRG